MNEDNTHEPLNNEEIIVLSNKFLDVFKSILHELKKTNIILRKQSKDLTINDTKVFDFDKMKGKSFLIVHDDFKIVKDIALKLCTNANKNIKFMEQPSNDGSFIQLLASTSENDYVVINLNNLSTEQIDYLLTAINCNQIQIKVEYKNQPIIVNLKPLNYILYSDMLELIDTRLTEILEVIQ